LRHTAGIYTRATVRDLFSAALHALCQHLQANAEAGGLLALCFSLGEVVGPGNASSLGAIAGLVLPIAGALLGLLSGPELLARLVYRGGRPEPAGVALFGGQVQEPTDGRGFQTMAIGIFRQESVDAMQDLDRPLGGRVAVENNLYRLSGVAADLDLGARLPQSARLKRLSPSLSQYS
jgi:hypothetical protein